ncbi:MAG: hypothetical protein U0637_00720 [Phycisphaerales bacterium]
MRIPSVVSLVAAASVTAWACAQTDGKAPPADAKPAAQAEQKPDPMAGPRVEAPEAKYTIVKAGLNGKLERITQPVEEAALAVLPLSAEERTKINKIVLDRAAAIDKGLRASVPVLLRIQGIREEGMTTDRQSAIRELKEKAPVLGDRDAYRSEIRLALSADNAKRFDAVVAEYMRAATMQNSADAKAEGRKGNAFLMLVVEGLRNTGMEVQQSFDRIVKEGTDRTDRLIELVKPTPEQEGKIRDWVRDYGERTKLNPTPQQRADFFKGLMRLLTIPQREALVADLYGSLDGAGAQPGEKPEPKPEGK